MPQIRFLHTADWQLGMRRHFLSEEALPRYRQARIDAIRTMAKVAEEQRCDFAVVCGDVFESNQIDRPTLRRTLEALDAMPCPIYLLPGNHDPLDAGSVFRHVGDHRRARVLASCQPVEIKPGVELVGAPWFSKRPQRDLVAEVLEKLEPTNGLRILAAHGPIGIAGDHDDPARIRREPLDAALDQHRVHYVALGDRHSATEVKERVWYSGTPEPTDFRETDPGFVLVVELDGERCDVSRFAVASWRFLERTWVVDDVDALERWLDSLPGKETTVLKLVLQGAVNLKAKAQLDEVLDGARETFAGLFEPADEIALVPDDLDLTELGLSGFARGAVDELTGLARDDSTARDALALLYRLSGGESR